MFKKFDEKENVSNCIQLKTSVIKGIKNQLLDQFPVIEPWLNQIMPKKDPVKIVRCHEHIEILTVNGELLFFRQREGIFYPTLRLLHKYPFILPHQQVDKGAIKFVLSGANIMCPGLTSPGAKLYPAAVDTVVAIMAEGKQHALCVGVMKMSAEDIEKVNKGIGIENIHYLNDGLWHMKTYNPVPEVLRFYKDDTKNTDTLTKLQTLIFGKIQDVFFLGSLDMMVLMVMCSSPMAHLKMPEKCNQHAEDSS
ncbi:Malignant T-cell-amplified sequence [Aix galericulata]|nr:Malignant T-cell-amplified sequence [Aix galericulata]